MVRRLPLSSYRSSPQGAWMVRVGSQPLQVVLVEIRLEPETLGDIGQRLERGPLLPRDAGDPHQ